MNEQLDLDHLRGWIGSADNAGDVVSQSLVDRFCATTGITAGAGNGAVAPRLIHFCLCQPATPMAELGEDGHPARGGFLPPVPLPRRMWAGSRIAFHGDLSVGDVVERRSVIADVVVKQGRTGTLCFVTVEHAFRTNGELRVGDRQTIVYRAPPDGTASPTPAPPAPEGEVVESIDASSVLLFRYSALTFNGHRIHYDAPYATGVEGYPGLVVHGPLQATMLLQLATRIAGRAPDDFGFQSISTLYDHDRILLNARRAADGTVSLWTARPGGPTAMQAMASWR